MEAHVSAPGGLPARRWHPPLLARSDEQLARLVGEGSDAAFEALYRRFHQPLYRYCRSMLRHEADAQDAFQAALTNALAALKRQQRDAPLRPWLFRIAHNEAVSVIRRRRADAERPEELNHAVASVESRAEERERFALLVSDLLELPERQRGALVMRELSGLTHEEIADALETSVGAAKQTIFEARRSLFDYAEGRAMPCEDVLRVISDADGRALRARNVRAHLRGCASCAAFAAAIPSRRAELRAVAPALPAAAATSLLARTLSAGGASGGAGAAGVAATVAGKSMSGGLIVKALAGLVVAGAATVGVTKGLEHPAAARHAPRPVARSARGPHAGGSALGLVRSPGGGVAAPARFRTGAHATSATTAATGRLNPGGPASGRSTNPWSQTSSANAGNQTQAQQGSGPQSGNGQSADHGNGANSGTGQTKQHANGKGQGASHSKGSAQAQSSQAGGNGHGASAGSQAASQTKGPNDGTAGAGQGKGKGKKST